MNRSKPARRLLPIAALLGSFTGTACVSDQRPEAPAILRDTFMIDDDVRFTHPYVPGHRTTIDGRVAAQVQGSGVLNVYLFAPEKLASPILTGPPGPELLADPTPVQLTFPPEMAGMTNGHTALCDAPGLGPDGTSNPYPCGPDSAHDCYDFKLVNTTWHQVIADFPWFSTGVAYLPVPIGGLITVLFVVERLWVGNLFDEPNAEAVSTTSTE